MKQFPIWTMSEEGKEKKDGKKTKIKRVQTPGPGHYNLKIGNLPNGPVYSMGKKIEKKRKRKLAWTRKI